MITLVQEIVNIAWTRVINNASEIYNKPKIFCSIQFLDIYLLKFYES